ncbi:M20 family metallopeptidase [Actinoplanes couchii]|uniref:Amidohydrolase n=1 Tax=Actinoplanes couchii TaxID=403638 RepID=A0ABQ3X8D0_9ACTN|nr:amidohydrolase [Actinoplanes couchii]
MPEVGLDLPRTRDVLVEELQDLPVQLVHGDKCTSVTAVLRGRGDGPVVLLRSDMDALPITERTGLPYAVPGPAMHACGHDLHMSALVGALRLLASREFDGTVIAAFQPGEEGHGGAALMLAEGLLDVAGPPPIAAYALHVIADLPSGVVHGRSGPIMAAYGILDVEITGRGAHGGRPHEGADPVPVLAETVTALHSYVDRRFDAFDPVVLTVGELRAGHAPNVIADSATLRAGVRTFSETNTARVAAELPRLVENLAAAHGITATAVVRPVMGPTINDPAAAALVAATAVRMFGPDRYVELARPRAGSEDFSEILRRVPGAFLYVGAADGESPAGNHSPLSRFDDRVLPDAAGLLAALALHHLTPERHR